MADAAYVFFDNEALALKKLPLVKPEVVAEASGAPAIVVPDDVSSLAEQVAKELQEPFVLLLMSSGHWKDFNWKSWLEKRL
jgi:hypothetical protein